MDDHYIGGAIKKKTSKRTTKKKSSKAKGGALTRKPTKKTSKKTSKKPSATKKGGAKPKKTTKTTKKKTTKRGRGENPHKIGGNVIADLLGVIGLGKKASKPKPKTTKRKTKRGGDFIDDIENFASKVANSPIVKGVATVAPIIGSLAPLLMAGAKKDPNVMEKPKTELQIYTTEIRQVERKLNNTEKDFLREQRNVPANLALTPKQWTDVITPVKKNWATERKTLVAQAQLRAIEDLYQKRHTQYLTAYRKPV